MNIIIKRIITLTVFFLCFLHAAFSTHIVGGVMNYKYLGNNNFRIDLYVYRDDIRAQPGAVLDNPAIIRVWDGVRETTQNFALPFDSFVPIGQIDPCATIAINERIDWTHYSGIINLPPNTSGYTIYYQRCCRNNSISNLTFNSRGNGAMDWGATYTISIPAAVNGIYINNTSPQILNYPPVYICNNKPITYDHRAIDENGDVLRYSLCTPFSGAFPNDPTNSGTLEPPPFQNVVWQAPYSQANMLGGIPLSINPVTGLLSGTPNTVGQFVVGICIDEFRNGVRLTRTIRDFQFNVVDCGLQVISSFFAPQVQCNNFTINFQNQSTGANSYTWYFGDGDSSNVQNPVHTYRDTGIYTVTLVAYGINGTCNASYSQQVSVQYQLINADFILQNNACLKHGDSLRFFDRSTDTLNIVSWNWTFSNGQSSSIKNPVLVYDGTATSISATLTVTSSNGCSSTLTKTFDLLKKPDISLPDSVVTCAGAGVLLPLTVSPNSNTSYTWTPATGLNNSTIQQPTATVNTNTTYVVTVNTTQGNAACIQKDTIKVKVTTTSFNIIQDSLKVCRDSVRLSVNGVSNVQWSVNSNFTPILSTNNPLVLYQTQPVVKYYVRGLVNGCLTTDSIIVVYSDTVPVINLDNSQLSCTNMITLNAVIQNGQNVIWSTSNTMSPVIGTSPSITLTQTPRTQYYFITSSYRFCTSKDSIKVIIQDTLPVIQLPDQIRVCRDSVRLNALLSNTTAVIWSTNGTTFNPVIGTTPSITVSQSQPRVVYYIKAFYRDCPVTDSIVALYDDTLPTIRLADSLFFCGNQVSANAIVLNYDNLVWSTSTSFIPILTTQPGFSTTQNNAIQYYYIKANKNSCSSTDSIRIRVQTNLPNMEITDSFYVCADSVRLVGRITYYDSIAWSFTPDFSTVFSHEPSIIVNQTEPEKMYYVYIRYLECETTDSFRVFKNDTLPSVSIIRTPTVFCNDSISATGVADFYTNLYWSDNRDFTHILATGLHLQTVQTATEQWYYFKAAYKFCESIDSIKLENRKVTIAAQAPSACLGDKVLIDLNVNTSGNYQIDWTIDEQHIVTSNTDTLSIYPSQSGQVNYSVTNQYGCTKSDSVNYTIFPPPIVDATVDKSIIYQGETVQLEATNNQNFSYNWMPENLVSNPAIFNPTSKPLQTTLYTIHVTDENGCINMDTVSVEVLNYTCDAGMVYIPNAFTPNGDGTNDTFKVRSEILKAGYLLIFDRWGNKIFETDNWTIGWDGTYKGKLCQDEAYGYYFAGECLQGEKITLKGNITLLR